jgi:carbon monoxide dehydrogenase subunit G
MEFENSFSVKAPIDEVYETLMDVERVAPAMPGAQVLEHTSDDEYKVGIKVKVGPVTMNYRGDVSVLERDPGAHAAKMSVRAKEARGQGTASADVEMSLSEENGSTLGHISTDVRLSGKVAAMGQGVIQDVSARMVDQFAQNLATMLAEPEAAEAAAEEAAPEQPAAEPAREPSPEPPAEPAESFDAVSVAAGVARDRLRDPKVLGRLVLVAVLLGFVLGRRSARR